MKILMTGDAVGGVWTYAVELIKALREYDVQVALATMGRRPSEQQRTELSSVASAILFESEYKLEWMEDPWQDVAEAGNWLLELERQFEPDVVHLNGYAHAALPWHAPKIVVAHSCIYSWWREVRGQLPSSDDEIYRQKTVQGLIAADCVIAPSNAMLRFISEIYGVRNDMFVIENGRDSALFAPATEKEPVVLSCGRLWDEAKNIMQLDRVSSQIPWPILLAGDPQEPEGRHSFAAGKTCVALGHLDARALADVMARASIFCLPAKYEPFGLSVLEAALAGCALVLGDIPSLRELWNGCGIFVNPDDDAQLIAALQGLISDPRRRERLASAARERAMQFTPGRMAGRYFDIYSNLAGTACQPGGREVHACGL